MRTIYANVCICRFWLRYSSLQQRQAFNRMYMYKNGHEGCNFTWLATKWHNNFLDCSPKLKSAVFGKRGKRKQIIPPEILTSNYFDNKYGSFLGEKKNFAPEEIIAKSKIASKWVEGRQGQKKWRVSIKFGWADDNTRREEEWRPSKQVSSPKEVGVTAWGWTQPPASVCWRLLRVLCPYWSFAKLKEAWMNFERSVGIGRSKNLCKLSKIAY